MPLIRNGAEAEDTWRFVGEDEGATEPVPADGGGVSYALSRFLQEAETLLDANYPIGVRLSPDDDPLALASYLDRLSLIEVDFPKYTDGRGYSHAQLLRRRLGYTGELRAVGHVLRDQLLYMHRSGFDAFSTSRADLASVLEALGEFSSFYQPAADGPRSVFAARHSRS